MVQVFTPRLDVMVADGARRPTQITRQGVIERDHQADWARALNCRSPIRELCFIAPHQPPLFVLFPSSAWICAIWVGSCCSAISAWLYMAVRRVCWFAIKIDSKSLICLFRSALVLLMLFRLT